MTLNPLEEVANKVLEPVLNGVVVGQSGLPAFLEQVQQLTTAAGTARRATTAVKSVGDAIQTVLPAAVAPIVGTSQAVLPSVVQAVIPGGTSQGGGVLSKVASGFGLGPLITGLIHLFGGGDPDEPPPLVKFGLPPSVSRVESLQTKAGAGSEVSYGQDGLPRIVGNATGSAPQITVQVQAMDSKSFLEHSEDIARAVRDAMLYSHSLNDVVTEL